MKLSDTKTFKNWISCPDCGEDNNDKINIIEYPHYNNDDVEHEIEFWCQECGNRTSTEIKEE